MTIRTFLVSTVFLLAAGPASAAGFVEHKHDDIRQDVRRFVLQEARNQNLEDVTVEVGSLDYRLKVHQCEKPLELSLPPYARFSSRLAVEVSCTDNKPWKLYIQSQVTAYRKVVVVSTPLLRTQIIDSSDVSLEKREISGLNMGYFTGVDQVSGKISRTNLTVGAIIAPRNIQIPKMVKRGEIVVILAESSGIQVRMSGKAMNDAVLGGRAKVMNSRSKRIVEGNVVEKGVVKVKM